jgi:hypothetical protein
MSGQTPDARTSGTSSADRFVLIDYFDELRQLDETYRAAASHDVSAFAAWLRAHGDRPLLTIGAGGSLAVAQMGAALHRRATGRLASSGEPMDLYQLDGRGDGLAVLLVTAGGGHSDSLAACGLLPSVPVDAAVFCGKTGSPGEKLLKDTGVGFFGYELLPDVHGWVAVNALLAQAVVLARAFAEAYPDTLGTVPATLAELAPDLADVDAAVAALADSLGDVLARDLLVFLHGPDTRTAAVDLDSKFAESGLGVLSVSEYRNFAHGRYQMLLGRFDECGVLAMYSSREAALAGASLGLIPEDLPHAGLAVPGGSPAAEHVGALLLLLLVLGALSKVRGVQVGWGSRNTFGDALYEIDLAPFLPHPRPAKHH